MSIVTLWLVSQIWSHKCNDSSMLTLCPLRFMINFICACYHRHSFLKALHDFSGKSWILSIYMWPDLWKLGIHGTYWCKSLGFQKCFIMLQIESHNGIAQMHTILLLVVKCVCVPGIVDACVKQSTYTYVSALVHTWYATHMNHASRYTHVLLTCNKHIMHVIRISGYLPLYS